MRHNILSLFIGTFLLLHLFSLRSLAEQQEIVLLTSQNGPDAIKQEEIRQIFLGKKTRWADDTKITFVLFSDRAVLQTFLKAYVGKTSSQYKNYWKKQVFTGKGRIPQSFKRPEDLLSFLAEHDGVIGFSRRGDVDSERVKVIKIE